MPQLGERAVVLGASMGGLLAARVLADYFQTVTVVERDVLPDSPANRRGVPQGRHTHALLRRGGQILDELFAGFLAELVADGAPVLDDGDFSKIWAEVGGHLLVRSGKARNVDDTAMYLASRPFLECHVRRRVTAIANVTILDGHDVAELTATPDRVRVTGVRVVERDRREEKVLSADLVVDAMGRGAHTPAFLERLGYGRPAEDHIVMHTTYATQLLRVSGAVERVVLVSAAPGRPKGMFLLSYENDIWVFTVFGMVGREPPGSRDGMLEFARDYAPAHVLSTVRAAEPLGEVIRHRMPSSQWRRYDKMRRFPDGLLVCGDAICSFNPVYGQGMTVSALEAAALRDCLRVGGHDLARRYFRAASKSIRVAWQMAAGGDLAFPEVQGRRSLSMWVSNRCVNWVLSACESDTVTAERFFRVNNLIDPPARLLDPGFICRVAAVNFRRRASRADRKSPLILQP